MGARAGSERATLAGGRVTETQRLARELDTTLPTLPRVLWPLLLPAAALVLEAQWSGRTEAGEPACVDCRRRQSYGSHVCSCPTGKVRKRLGAML